MLTVPVSGRTFSYNLQWATIMTFHRFKLRLVIGTLALAVVSCGGDDVTAPTEGSIRIQTTTSGSDLDADGYAVRLDDGQPLAIALSGEVVIEEVRIGRYFVALTGMAVNCTTEGDNPQPVDVVGGETVTVIFEVTCAPVDGGGGGGPTE